MIQTRLRIGKGILEIAWTVLLVGYALMAALGAFSIVSDASRDALVTSKTAVVAGTVGIQLLLPGLIVLRPRWPAAVAALLGYCLVFVPLMLARGCHLSGFCS